jgi:hypothetical protein
MHPLLGLRAVEVENQPRQVKGGVALKVKQDEKQFRLGREQARFPSTTDSALTHLSLSGLFVNGAKGF